MKPVRPFSAIARTIALGVLLALGARAQAQTDPLPSWNDGPAKQAIVAFVKETTERGARVRAPGGAHRRV